MKGDKMSFLVGSEIALYSPSQDNEGNGTETLNDLVGSNNGMISGATWQEDTEAGGVRALEFSNDYIFVSNSGDFAFGADPFWFSVWFKLTSTDQQMILDKGFDTGTTTRLFFILLNSTQYRFWAGDLTGSLTFTASGYLNTWTNAICQRNGTSMAAYINGNLAASGTSQPIGQSLTNNDNLSIGSRSDQTTNFMKGRVDEVRFGTGVLTAADIAKLSSSRLPLDSNVSLLDPSELKPGLTEGANLNPSMVRGGYAGGTPTSADDLKPTLVGADGNLKPSLVTPSGELKPGFKKNSS